jgi:hypothetical protein
MGHKFGNWDGGGSSMLHALISSSPPKIVFFCSRRSQAAFTVPEKIRKIPKTRIETVRWPLRIRIPVNWMSFKKYSSNIHTVIYFKYSFHQLAKNYIFLVIKVMANC